MLFHFDSLVKITLKTRVLQETIYTTQSLQNKMSLEANKVDVQFYFQILQIPDIWKESCVNIIKIIAFLELLKVMYSALWNTVGFRI